MQLWRLWLLAAVLLVGVIAGVASAKVIYVAPGEEFEEAFEDAEPGDTVIVLDGFEEKDEIIEIPDDDLDGLIIRTESPGGATLRGLKVQANQIQIFGFNYALSPPRDRENEFAGLHIFGDEARVSVNNMIIESSDEGDIHGIIFEQAESGHVDVIGTVIVDAAGDWATGISILDGAGTFDVFLGGDVVVTNEGAGAVGVYALPGKGGEDATIFILGTADRPGQGDIIVLAEDYAGGILAGVDVVRPDPDDPDASLEIEFRPVDVDEVEVFHEGDIIITAEGQQSVAGGILLAAENGSVEIFGDTTVRAGAIAGGAAMIFGDHGQVRLHGDVHVLAEAEDSDGHGVYIEFLQNGEAKDGKVDIFGDVQVEAAWAHGVEILGKSEVFIFGDVTAKGEAQAHSVEIFGDDQSKVFIFGDVAAKAETEAQGIAIFAGAEGNLAIFGDVTAVADGRATGVEIFAGDASTFYLAGDVFIFGGGEDDGAARPDQGRAVSFGRQEGEEERPDQATVTILGDIFVEADGLAEGVHVQVGEESVVLVDGSNIDIFSYDDGSGAYGAHIIAGAESDIHILAEAEVEAGAYAAGVIIEGDDDTDVEIFGGYSVTARDDEGKAVGLEIFLGDNSRLSSEADIFVQAEGEDAAAVGIILGGEYRPDSAEEGRPGALVVLDGIIFVEAQHATGVDINQVSGSAEILNYGVIDAWPGVAVDGSVSDARIWFRNLGDIFGDILFGEGDIDVWLGEESSVHGDIILGDGGDKIVTVLAGAILEGDLRSEGALSVLRLRAGAPGGTTKLHDIAVFDDAYVTGGYWIFGGKSEIFILDIEGGHVHVAESGEILGDILAVNGGILSGEGVINSAVWVFGGAVAPGRLDGDGFARPDSFGVLTVVGTPEGRPDDRPDYWQTEDGVLIIKIRPSEDPEPGVDHDQLNVLGTAVFENGTTIRILPAPGVYRSGMNYIIVDGDVQFDPEQVNVIIGTKGALFLDAQLQEGSIEILLETKPFEDVARPGNQEAVAAVLTAAKDRPGTQLDEVYDWLFMLETGDEVFAQEGLDSLSGEVYTALPTLASRRLDSLVAGAGQGLTQGQRAGRQFWAVGQGSSGRIEADAQLGTAASDIQLRGLTVGVELLGRERAQAGLLAGFLSETLTMDDRRSAVRGSSVHLGGYGQWNLAGVSLRGVVGVSSARNESERRVALGGTEKTAQGSFGTTDTVVAVEGRFAGFGTDQVRVVPVVSLGRYSTHRTGFEETGADTLGLNVQAYDAAWVRGRLSVEVGPASPGDNGLAWHGRLGWVKDFSVAERTATASFQGAPDEPFTVKGTPVQTSGFEVELGIGGARERVSWGVSYSGQFRADGDNHQLQASVGLSF